jgi:hypothetical protein
VTLETESFELAKGPHGGNQWFGQLEIGPEENIPPPRSMLANKFQRILPARIIRGTSHDHGQGMIPASAQRRIEE